MTNEQLLAEIEEILRTIPSGTSFATYGTEGLSWLGRATAVIEAWDALKGTVSRAPRTLTSSISSGPSAFATRSEERRVGKECRSQWARYHERKNGVTNVVC